MASAHLGTLATVLQVNGRIPRRAVLLGDGRLADRVHHPSAPEAELVSRVCEIVKHACGMPCQPRQTADVLERALTKNDTGAWEAIKDDLLTGDLDL